MALDLDSGNAVGLFPDERAALLMWNDWVKQWPDVDDHLAIIEFDGAGMPVRTVQGVQLEEDVA